ncbi:glycoprotein endo-alpha-1,2-mannosidase-like protein [Oculina patagonica]
MSPLRFLRKRRVLHVAVLCLFVLGCLATLKVLSSSEEETKSKPKLLNQLERDVRVKGNDDALSLEADHDAEEVEHKEIRQNKQIDYNEIHEETKPALTSPNEEDSSLPEPNYNIHIFYYAWYGNPEHDGKYVHWNHQFLSHWDPNVAKNYKKGSHSPPDDIGANFYPALGPYSSKDPEVIDEHMREMRTAGVGVVVLSWYPPGKADNEGIPSDSLVPTLLNAAAKYRLKITLHVEPYKGRDDQTLHDDVKYIIDTYGKHEAFYKYKTADGRTLPMLYIYDSYQTPAEAWAQLMTTGGSHSVRNTPYDCIFIALMVEMNHRRYIDVGGFDGFYTYFATDKFTYGSTWRFWPQLKSIAEQTNSLFIPSVGPGYIDTGVRPWNGANTRLRDNGNYYRNSWKAALQTSPHIISITSFNEWHEGTQIEKAIPKSSTGLLYKDYSPNPPDFYLKLTKEYVEKFAAIHK